jgi:hypothetical protein
VDAAGGERGGKVQQRAAQAEVQQPASTCPRAVPLISPFKDALALAGQVRLQDRLVLLVHADEIEATW